MTVTVAIPTCRRDASLDRLLTALPAALAGVETPRVLVVDNDPAGSAKDVVGDRADYVLEPEPGSAFARNRALAETTTELIAYLDDDVTPSRHWLRELLAPFAHGAAAVGGRVVLDPTVARPRWLDEAGIGGYLTAFDLTGPPRALHAGEYVVTANAAFRTDALRATGGFDPQLGPRPGAQVVADDVHVVREVQRQGGEVWWQPAAEVVHELTPERLRMRWLLRRAYLQGRSDWLLDEADLRARRAGGARVAVSWLSGQARVRSREGLLRPEVAFHLATDVSRTLGSLQQGLRWLGD